jgi:transcription elongation factor Elf1
MTDKASRAEYLVSRLRAKNALLPCPRCGSRHLSVIGERNLRVQAMEGQGLLGLYDKEIALAVIGCNNCGFLMEHATATLERQGVLPEGRFPHEH